MEGQEAKQMKIGFKSITDFPDEICVEILARLPFKIIMRFKAVCRRWREVTETSYFRRKFMFAHRNSSSSWSIMQGSHGWSSREAVGFYGCERYGLPRSLDSYIPPYHDKSGDINTIKACVDGLVLLQTVSSRGDKTTYSVGNPVLNQWVQLPPYPFKVFTRGLVTKVEDGVIVEYKVVFMDEKYHDLDGLRFDIFSSKTRIWIRKQVRCLPNFVVSFNYRRSLSLNKKLHWLDEYGKALVAFDFFAEDENQQCQVIPFPDSQSCARKTYTTSGGFIVYITKIQLQLRLWRLEEYTSDSGRWELMQDIDLTSFGCNHKYYFPVTMHPFETHIIYMATMTTGVWTLVSIDLETLKLIRHTNSSTYSDKWLNHYLRNISFSRGQSIKVFYAPQFILPQWMESVYPLPSI